MPPANKGKWRAFVDATKSAKSDKEPITLKIDREVLESYKALCRSNGIELSPAVEKAMQDFIAEMSQPQLSLTPVTLHKEDRE